jgi:hypothetical protein
MQLSEALADSGEHILLIGVADKEDTDQDGVKKINYAGGAHGIAPVLANKVRVQRP